MFTSHSYGVQMLINNFFYKHLAPTEPLQVIQS